MENHKQTKSYLLQEIPSDVYKILIREQNKIKEKKGTSQFSIERTIYHIIKKYDRCIDTECLSVDEDLKRA